MKPAAVVGAIGDLGPIEATADDWESVPIPPLVGALAIAGGVILLVTGRRRA